MAEQEFRIRITGDAAELQQASQAGASALRGLESAAGPAAEQTAKVGANAGDLQRIFRELGREFPILGMAARTLMSPVAAAAGAAVLLFDKLQASIQEISAELETTEWERYGEGARKAMEGGAAGATTLRREVEAIRLAADRAIQASTRLMDVYRARMTAEERADEARKRVELARLGGETDPAKRAAAEAEIESRYAARARARADELSRFQLAEQHRQAANAEIAERRLAQQLEAAEARKAEVARVDARLAEERKRLAAIVEERAKKQERLEALEGLVVPTPAEMVERAALSGQVRQLGAMEEQQRGYIGRLEARRPRPVSEEYLQMLEQMRSGAAARASGIAGMLPTQMAVAGIESATRRQVGGLEDLARAYTAAGQVEQQRSRLAEQIVRMLEAGQGTDRALLQQLAALMRLQETLWADVRMLQSRVAGMRAR